MPSVPHTSLPRDCIVTGWRPARGVLYVVVDERGDLLIAARTMKNVQQALLACTGQLVPSSCLFESALHQLKKGRTRGSYTVMSFGPHRNDRKTGVAVPRDGPREDALEFINGMRYQFEARILVCNPEALDISRTPAEPEQPVPMSQNGAGDEPAAGPAPALAVP